MFLAEAIELQDYDLLLKAIHEGEALDEVLCELDEMFHYTALSSSVIAGNTKFVKTLLDSGANPNVRNWNGSTALTCAETAELTLLLAQSGGKVGLEQPEGGMTSLHLAAESGRVSQVEVLLSAAGAVEALEWFDRVSRTPLGCAAERGHLGVIDVLIRSGADPNPVNTKGCGYTPLQLAIEGRHKTAAQKLLRNGAKPDFRQMGPPPKELAREVGLDDLFF